MRDDAPNTRRVRAVTLGDSDFVPANPEDDLRGKAVYHAQGQRMAAWRISTSTGTSAMCASCRWPPGDFWGWERRTSWYRSRPSRRWQRIGSPSSWTGHSRWTGRPPSTPK